MPDTDELRELVAAATKGPWSFCSCGCRWLGGGDDEVAIITAGKWGDEGVDILTGKRELVHHWGTVPPERADANGKLAALAPTLAQTVIDQHSAIESLTQENERLAKQRLMILAALYPEVPKFVATICDESLDRSGALLGQVRETARAAISEKQG